MIQVHIEVYISGEIIIHFLRQQTQLHLLFLEMLQFLPSDIHHEHTVVKYGLNLVDGGIVQIIEIYGEVHEMKKISTDFDDMILKILK